jgi:hypothetical protein
LVKKPMSGNVYTSYKRLFQSRSIIDLLGERINGVAKLLSMFCEILDRTIDSCSCRCVSNVSRYVCARQKSFISSHVLWMTAGIVVMIIALIFETVLSSKM